MESVCRIVVSVAIFMFAAAPSFAAESGGSQALLDSYNAVLATDPNNVPMRAARCAYFADLTERAGSKAEWQNLRRRALVDCNIVLKTATQGRQIANTIDTIRVLEWQFLFMPKQYACPENARQAATVAYSLFLGLKLTESLPQYRRAAEGCPENASGWVEYGNTYMLMGDLRQAERYILEGLKRDRWHRAANLFLSDLYRRQGQVDLAYKHSALAVISDPLYEFGWEQLRELTKASGREWRRVVNQRAVVAVDGENPQINLALWTNFESPEFQFWFNLAVIEASEVKADVKPNVFLGIGHDLADTVRQRRQSETTNPNALINDRDRVRKNLEIQRKRIAKDAKYRSVLTDVVEEALQKGYLDEAIFLNLIDWRLVPAYAEYREKHADRLLDYIASVLAPPRRL
jgi:tetratricopeptide (TPR) repeat protein